MKFELTLHSGSHSSDHRVELHGLEGSRLETGELEFLLDGTPIRVDWAEIAPGIFSVLIGGRSYEARVIRNPAASAGERSYVATIATQNYIVDIKDRRRWRREAGGGGAEGPQELIAPMPGRIVRVLVARQQEVERDQGLLVIEAMKMQNEIRAPRSGRVEAIYVAEGTGVEAGAKLLRLS